MSGQRSSYTASVIAKGMAKATKSRKSTGDFGSKPDHGIYLSPAKTRYESGRGSTSTEYDDRALNVRTFTGASAESSLGVAGGIRKASRAPTDDVRTTPVLEHDFDTLHVAEEKERPNESNGSAFDRSPNHDRKRSDTAMLIGMPPQHFRRLSHAPSLAPSEGSIDVHRSQSLYSPSEGIERTRVKFLSRQNSLPLARTSWGAGKRRAGLGSFVDRPDNKRLFLNPENRKRKREKITEQAAVITKQESALMLMRLDENVREEQKDLVEELSEAMRFTVETNLKTQDPHEYMTQLEKYIRVISEKAGECTDKMVKMTKECAENLKKTQRAYASSIRLIQDHEKDLEDGTDFMTKLEKRIEILQKQAAVNSSEMEKLSNESDLRYKMKMKEVDILRERVATELTLKTRALERLRDFGENLSIQDHFIVEENRLLRIRLRRMHKENGVLWAVFKNLGVDELPWGSLPGINDNPPHRPQSSTDKSRPVTRSSKGSSRPRSAPQLFKDFKIGGTREILRLDYDEPDFSELNNEEIQSAIDGDGTWKGIKGEDTDKSSPVKEEESIHWKRYKVPEKAAKASKVQFRDLVLPTRIRAEPVDDRPPDTQRTSSSTSTTISERNRITGRVLVSLVKIMKEKFDEKEKDILVNLDDYIRPPALGNRAHNASYASMKSINFRVQNISLKESSAGGLPPLVGSRQTSIASEHSNMLSTPTESPRSLDHVSESEGNYKFNLTEEMTSQNAVEDDDDEDANDDFFEENEWNAGELQQPRKWKQLDELIVEADRTRDRMTDLRDELDDLELEGEKAFMIANRLCTQYAIFLSTVEEGGFMPDLEDDATATLGEDQVARDPTIDAIIKKIPKMKLAGEKDIGMHSKQKNMKALYCMTCQNAIADDGLVMEDYSVDAETGNQKKVRSGWCRVPDLWSQTIRRFAKVAGMIHMQYHTLCDMILDIYYSKILSDEADDADGQTRTNLSDFVIEHYLTIHPKEFFDKQLYDLFCSMVVYGRKSKFVYLFCRFCGLFDSDPPHMLDFYLTIIKMLRHHIKKPDSSKDQSQNYNVEFHVVKSVVNELLRSESQAFRKAVVEKLQKKSYTVGIYRRVDLEDALELLMEEWEADQESLRTRVENLWTENGFNLQGAVKMDGFATLIKAIAQSGVDILHRDIVKLYRETLLLKCGDSVDVEDFTRMCRKKCFLIVYKPRINEPSYTQARTNNRLASIVSLSPSTEGDRTALSGMSSSNLIMNNSSANLHMGSSSSNLNNMMQTSMKQG